jgi:hypothetical protein
LKSAVGRAAEALKGWAPLDRHLPSAIPLSAGFVRLKDGLLGWVKFNLGWVKVV